MTQGKHTQGPWSARKAAHGPIDIVAEDGRDIVTLYGGGVDEDKADNARLIAAAPEILEALKTANEKLRSLLFDGDEHPLVAASNAAIAKAEGR